MAGETPESKGWVATEEGLGVVPVETFYARCPCGWIGTDRASQALAMADADAHTAATGHAFDHQGAAPVAAPATATAAAYTQTTKLGVVLLLAGGGVPAGRGYASYASCGVCEWRSPLRAGTAAAGSQEECREANTLAFADADAHTKETGHRFAGGGLRLFLDRDERTEARAALSDRIDYLETHLRRRDLSPADRAQSQLALEACGRAYRILA